jgi:hypothetical protein
MSLSINYVPAKFAKLHAPGEYAHRRKGRDDEGLVKRGGGRSAFADDAGRMGAVGFVDDDYGTEYKVGKGGLKRKDKKKWGRLRWNRFKWCLFVANTVVSHHTFSIIDGGKSCKGHVRLGVSIQMPDFMDANEDADHDS